MMGGRLSRIARCAFACGLLALVASATAGAAELPSEPAFYAFRLQGSNGYELTIAAAREAYFGYDYVSVRVSRPGATATYVAKGVVMPSSIRADFGRFGRVDVTVSRSGTAIQAPVKCSKQKESFEPGELEGTIDFRGEGGFTSVSSSRASLIPWSQTYSYPCGASTGESFGPNEPGARLKGASFSGGKILQFQFNKNRPKGQTLYQASLRERRGGVTIFREVKGVDGPAAFRFGRSLRTARLSPAAPFTGTGALGRSADSVSALWMGSLGVDFPGRPAYPIAGPSVHVSLMHARRIQGEHGSVGITFG